jgi:hypothetical protein
MTVVPPDVEPVFGVTSVSAGGEGAGAVKLKPLLSETDDEPTVTTTVAGPVVPAGVVAVISVLDWTTTLVAGADPRVTLVCPTTKPAPTIVTVVPPAADAVVGLIDVTESAPVTGEKKRPPPE